MKESIPSYFALIFPMVMKQAETIRTFHLEIMCTTSLQTIFVCCISNFVFLPFGSNIYIYVCVCVSMIKLRTNLSSHQNNLFRKSKFKILYSEIVFTQKKKKKENLGLKNKDIVKVNKKNF